MDNDDGIIMQVFHLKVNFILKRTLHIGTKDILYIQNKKATTKNNK